MTKVSILLSMILCFLSNAIPSMQHTSCYNKVFKWTITINYGIIDASDLEACLYENALNKQKFLAFVKRKFQMIITSVWDCLNWVSPSQYYP